MKLLTALLAVAVLCSRSLPSAHAATVLFENAAVGPDTILSNVQTSNPITLTWRNLSSTNNRWIGFAFSAPSDTQLSSVSFKLSSVLAGALGADMTISIVSLTSLSAVPASPFGSTLLYSETGVVPATYSSESYITFALATPFQLSNDSVYGIVLSFNSAAANREIDISAAGVTSGDLGRSFYTTAGQLGGDAYTGSSRPANFIMTTVPEPSTAALWLLGISIVAGMVTRKRISVG